MNHYISFVIHGIKKQQHIKVKRRRGLELIDSVKHTTRTRTHRSHRPAAHINTDKRCMGMGAEEKWLIKQHD